MTTESKTMKMTVKNIVKSAAGLTLPAMAFLALAGCSGSAHFSDGDPQKRNEVAMVRIPFMLTFEADQAALSAAAIEQLDRFLVSSNVSYGDELSMDFPLERDGDLSPQNRERMAYLSDLLKKRGLHLAVAVTPFGLSPAENQARFLVSRYVVTPPQCGDWSEPSTGNYGNASLKDLGCASQAQLGLMIANPRDLVTGVSNNIPNAEQAAGAVAAAYKKKTSGKAYSGSAKK